MRRLRFIEFAALAMFALNFSRANGEMLIDVHVHINGRYGMPMQMDYAGATTAALNIMSDLGIGLSITMPPPFGTHQPSSNIYDIEDYADVIVGEASHIKFFGGGGSLNVMLQQAIESGTTSVEMRTNFEARAHVLLDEGALGFGEFASEHFSFNAQSHPYLHADADHHLLLLLSDLAAQYHVPIDIHMEAIETEMDLPSGFPSPPNPQHFAPNLPAFERLLAYNSQTKIVWDHLGWDNTGQRSVALTRDLLQRYPNLYMSIKIAPDSLSSNRPVDEQGNLKTEWLTLFREFPDRFFLGSDQFYLSPISGEHIGPPSVEPTIDFWRQLPEDLSSKIGYENAISIYNISISPTVTATSTFNPTLTSTPTLSPDSVATPSPSAIPIYRSEDLTHDGLVNYQDLFLFLNDWLATIVKKS